MEPAVFVGVPLEARSTCLNLHKNRCERFSYIPSNLQQLWLHCQLLKLESVCLTISLQSAQLPKPSSYQRPPHRAKKKERPPPLHHLFTLTRSVALITAAPSWRTHRNLWTTQGLQHRAKTSASKQGAGHLLPQPFKVISLARRGNSTKLQTWCSATLSGLLAPSSSADSTCTTIWIIVQSTAEN